MWLLRDQVEEENIPRKGKRYSIIMGFRGN